MLVKGSMIVHGSQPHSMVADDRRRSIHVWQDRFRDPALSVLLVLEIGMIFVGAPLAAKGLSTARPIIETILLAVVVIVGFLSHRRIANAAILLGVAANLAGRWIGSEWPLIAAALFHRGGDILMFAALT